MTTATQAHTSFKLPAQLRERAESYKQALALPLLAEWPEDADYRDAPQPERIGSLLVCHLHTNLRNANIGYLFREKLTRNGYAIAGKASKVSGKLAHYTELNFLIEVSWEEWRAASNTQRIALIDHELSHLDVISSDAGWKYVMVPHDLEEFNSIVRRWGKWTRDVERMAHAIQESEQRDMFEAGDDWTSDPPPAARDVSPVGVPNGA